MSNNDRRVIMQELKDMGCFEYGASTPIGIYRKLFNIEYPQVGTKKDFDEVSLMELNNIDFIRSQLLNEGKYLKVENDHVRILLPSENMKQVEAYMGVADNKLKRAIKLAKNTPKEVSDTIDNTTARCVMKRESIRDSQNRYASI